MQNGQSVSCLETDRVAEVRLIRVESEFLESRSWPMISMIRFGLTAQTDQVGSGPATFWFRSGLTVYVN